MNKNKSLLIRYIYYPLKSVTNSWRVHNATMSSERGKQTIQQLFGRNVQKFRKQAGLTQEQLSERLGISQKHLSIIETGTQFASATLIAKLSETLQVTPADLFGGTSSDELKQQMGNVTATLMTFLANELTRMRTLLYADIEALLKKQTLSYNAPEAKQQG